MCSAIRTHSTDPPVLCERSQGSGAGRSGGGTRVPHTTAPSRPGKDSVTAPLPPLSAHLRARYRGLLQGGWTRRAVLASEETTTPFPVLRFRSQPPSIALRSAASSPGVERALLVPALSSHRCLSARPALCRSRQPGRAAAALLWRHSPVARALR